MKRIDEKAKGKEGAMALKGREWAAGVDTFFFLSNEILGLPPKKCLFKVLSLTLTLDG